MTAQVEKFGDRIWLRSPYSDDNRLRAKSVPGAYWSKKNKVWTYPLSLDTCRSLRRAFGKDLEICENLWAWAASEKDRVKTMVKLAISGGDEEMEDVRALSPVLADAMGNRTYQRTGARYIKEGKQIIIGDQPGMGKTLETVGGILEAGVTGPILVFCPATAIKATWERELRRWAPAGDAILAVTGTKFQRQRTLDSVQYTTGERVWIICNIEMVRTKVNIFCDDGWCMGTKAKGAAEKAEFRACGSTRHRTVIEHDYPFFFQRAAGWPAIVVDESHKALICQRNVLHKMTQTRAGMSLLPSFPDQLRIALSGTPWRGKPKNFWGTLNWLRPQEYTSMWRWAERWFEVWENAWGGREISNDVRPELQDEFTEHLQSIMLRRTKEECIADLPLKSYVDVVLPMSLKQAKAYSDMQHDAIARLDGGNLNALGVLAEITRAKQFAVSHGRMEGTGKFDEWGEEELAFRPDFPSNKFDYLVDFLAERGIEKDEPYGDSKVVVASQYTQVINLFAQALRDKGIDSYVLTGETKQRDRAKIIEDFQENPNSPRVFFINTSAGGVSVTLDAADDLVFIDETHIPDDQEQVEDRIHRASRIHNVTIYRLISEGTIDESIYNTNVERDQIQKTLMDGPRGVEFARKLLEGKESA